MTAAAPRANGVTVAYVAFAAGAVAQGVPLAVVIVALDRPDAGSAWLAAAAIARVLPYLVVAPLTGVLAAAVEPRHLLRAVGIARAVLAGGLGAALATGAPGAVTVAVLFVLVSVGCPAYPALMRIVRSASPDDRLHRSTTLGAGIESVTFWAGPALGGALLGLGGVRVVTVACAVALASALLAGLVPSVARTGDVEPRAVGQTVRRAAASMLTTAVRPAVAAVVGLNLLAGCVATTLVRLPAELGIGDEQTFGVLSAANGAGAVVAFVALAVRAAPWAGVGVIVLAGGVSTTVLGAGGALAVAVAACAVLGASVMASEVAATGVVCGRVPAALVAPVFGVLDAAMVASMVAGSAVGSVSMDTIGLRPALVLAGLTTPIAVVVATRAARPAARRVAIAAAPALSLIPPSRTRSNR